MERKDLQYNKSKSMAGGNRFWPKSIMETKSSRCFAVSSLLAPLKAIGLEQPPTVSTSRRS